MTGWGYQALEAHHELRPLAGLVSPSPNLSALTIGGCRPSQAQRKLRPPAGLASLSSQPPGPRHLGLPSS